jgi:transmembrane sensor
MGEDGIRPEVAQEAADWLAKLNSRTVSTEELNAFYEWRRDPRNAEAYAKGEQLWHDARLLGDDREIADAVRDALERPRLAGRAGGASFVSRRALLLGGGLTIAAVAGVVLTGGRGEVHRTAVGQQLAVRLDDGSLMRLNTDSEARVRFSAKERLVDLVQGQAFFDVRREAERPFLVSAGGLEVAALGTRFDVLNLEGRPARVVLAEGAVRVTAQGSGWQRSLSRAGEAVLAGSDGAFEATMVDVESVTSWTAGRLTFRGTPLAQAIEEVNRHSRVKIVLQAQAFAGAEVDGVFEAGDPQAFLSAVTVLFSLEASSSGERILLRSR